MFNQSLKWCKIDPRLFQAEPCSHGSEVPALLEHPCLAFGNLLLKLEEVLAVLFVLGMHEPVQVGNKCGLFFPIAEPLLPSFKIGTVGDWRSFFERDALRDGGLAPGSPSG